jgi:hypothetical protein
LKRTVLLLTILVVTAYGGAYYLVGPGKITLQRLDLLPVRENVTVPDVTVPDVAADPVAGQLPTATAEIPKEPAEVPKELATEDKRPLEVLTAGFTGSSSCTSCHEDQHKSWHASFHRTMTQKVDVDSFMELIGARKVKVAGVDYEFTREGNRCFVKFDDPIESAVETVKKELVLLTGSHHMTVCWYESPFGRTLAMLPIVYLRDQQRWIERNAAFVRQPGTSDHELGRWNQVCSRCHSTHPRGRLKTETEEWDTHVVDFGIACEACHGPGEFHIKYHKRTVGVGKFDDKVVSPLDLGHKRQSDVCGHCHSVQRPDFAKYSQDKLMQEGMPFRPGDDLEESPLRVILRPSSKFEGTPGHARAQQEPNLQNTFWPDGMVRVAGREYNAMVESPCFQNGEMSCLSCHTMHPPKSTDLDTWRDDQLKPGMRTNKACTQCHKEPKYNKKIAEHTHHLDTSQGSQCMNCHMPHSTYGLLKTVRNHHIESPALITMLQTGRPNGCALCHLDRNIGWVGDHLTEWYGQPPLQLSPFARGTASSLVNSLIGDAGIRAVYAASFAWEPAREASGSDWMAPYLLLGLTDEYDAIRLIAKRTLQTLPGYENVDIDEFAAAPERIAAVNRYLAEFKQAGRLRPRPELLIDQNGRIDFEKASEMFNARDQTPIFLSE